MAGGELENKASSVEPDAVLVSTARENHASANKLPALDVVEKFEVALNKQVSKAKRELADTNEEIGAQKSLPPEKFDQQLLDDLEVYRDELIEQLADVEPQWKVASSAKAILAAIVLLRKKVEVIASDLHAVDKELAAAEGGGSRNPTTNNAVALDKDALEETKATLNRQMRVLTTQIKAKEQASDLVEVQELMDPQLLATWKQRKRAEQILGEEFVPVLPPPPVKRQSDSNEVDQMIAALNAFQAMQEEPEQQGEKQDDVHGDGPKMVSLVERPKSSASENEEEFKNIYKLSSEKRGTR